MTGSAKMGEKKGRKISWFSSVLPFSIASGPLSTFVQLTILEQYGQNLGTVYVGLIVTLFNGVTIPAAMFWGFATDRFHKRKPIITLSFVFIAVNLIAFNFTSSVYGVGLLYSIFSFLSTASTTPYNLLIMETQPKLSWASAFARFSMISSIGSVTGLILSALWASVLPLHWLVIVLASFSLVSVALSLVLIKEPTFVFEREIMTLNRTSFFERLQSVPMIFLRLPRANEFKRVFKDLRYELTSQVPVLYLSIVAFYVASGIFNTSLVPSMTANRFSESEIYTVSVVGVMVQTVSFMYVAPYIAKQSLVRTAIGGLVLRAACYAALGFSVYFIVGIQYIVPTLIFYPMAGGIAFAAYYTASNTMVFNSIGSKGAGSTLGVYSALVGVASMVGSFVSGFTSVYFGFDVTFLLAAFCLAVSAVLTSRLSMFKRRLDEAPKARP
ncbi:MAG: MFS transporter [Nitrososphaerales archaeon]